jgi:Fe-S-cluster containining protein
MTMDEYQEGFQALEAVYRQADQRLAELSAVCRGCGRCCDFEAAGHQLWATRLEIAYMKERGGPMVHPGQGRCPWQGPQGRCLNRDGRVLGCRVFFCRLDEEVRSAEYELLLSRLREIHDALELDWRYVDVCGELFSGTALS